MPAAARWAPRSGNGNKGIGRLDLEANRTLSYFAAFASARLSRLAFLIRSGGREVGSEIWHRQ